jgi:hypothetical protein
MRTGWLEAIGNVIGIGALGLAYAVGNTLDAHPVAFILYAMVASAAAMLAFTGFGPDVRAIARHPLSWVVGASIILIEVFYFVTLMQVPPAHGNLIVRVGVPIAMIAAWLFFGRRPPALAMVAGALVFLAVAYVVTQTTPEVRWPMAIAGSLTGAFMVVRSFAAEFHPWNRAARTVREKLRLTGIVVLITSSLGIALTALAAAAIASGVFPPIRFVPDARQMFHVPTIALGSLAGGAILTLMAYLGFSAVVKIGTENHTAAMALAPVTSWMFQEIGVVAGLIAVTRPEPRLVAAMAVIVVAVLMIFRAARRKPAASR